MANLLGEIKAEETLKKLLRLGHENGYKYGDGLSGYFQDESQWIAYDNRTNDCWVEQFKTRKECLRWLK